MAEEDEGSVGDVAGVPEVEAKGWAGAGAEVGAEEG